MTNKKITSPKRSFKGFDWKKWVLSNEKPVIALLGSIIVFATEVSPKFAIIAGGIGLSSVKVYNLAKFFFKEY